MTEKVDVQKIRVSELEDSIEQKRRELDQLMSDWFMELPDYVSSWIDKTVDSIRKEKAEKILSMEADSVGEMKAEIEKIKGDLEKNCKESFDGLTELPHHVQLPPMPTQSSVGGCQNRYKFKPYKMVHLVQRCSRPFGELMKKNGLVDANSEHWESNNPPEIDKYKAERIAKEPPAFSKYSTIREDYFKAIDRLKEEKKALVQLEADDVWNQTPEKTS